MANDTATPEQSVPVDLTISGTNNSTGTAYIEAVVRPAGGLACQASYSEDVSTLGSEDTVVVGSVAQPVATGAYSVNANFKPAAAGSFQVCVWLSSDSFGTSALAGPASVSLTARGPAVSQLTVLAAKDLQPGVPFQITYTTQTDQQLNLLSVVAKAGPAPCAASYEQQSQRVTTVFGFGRQVFGGPVTTSATVTERTGFYVICTWVQGPDPQEVDGSTTTPVTVGTPTTGPPKPGLRLRRVSASRHHGISVAGTSAAKFTGRLVIAAVCGRSTSRTRSTVKHDRFTAHVRVPAGCRTARRVKVTASWSGSKAWARQSTTKSVALAR